MTQTAPQHRSKDIEACIQNCEQCHHVCIETVSYCLQQGGKHAEASHIRLLQDCIMICHTSADFMLRGSPFHHRTCGVCAEICEQCAQECNRIGDDPQMKACAEACRRCAESCRQMAAMAA